MNTPRDGSYWKTFTLISVITFLAYTSNFFFIPFLPVYMKDAGYTQLAIGWAVGAFAVSSVFIRPLAGGLMDCWSRRLFVLLGCLILTVVPLFYPWAHSLAGLVLLRICHGVGISFVVTAGTVLVADIAPPGRLSRSTGNYMSSVSLALILAPILAERVMGSHPASFWPFVLWPVAAAVPALAGSLFVREANCSAAPTENYSFPASLAGFTQKPVWVPTVTFFCCQITQGAIFAFVPLLTLSWPHPAVAGVYFALYGAAVISVRLTLGHLADRYGRHRVVLPAMLSSSLGVGLIFFSHDSWSLLTGAVVYGFGYGLAYPGLSAFVVDQADERKRGAALGFFATALGAGTLLGPVMAGFLVQLTGLAAMFLWLALAPLVGAVLFAVAFRHPETGRPDWRVRRDMDPGHSVGR